jgi:hypothetical protein
MVDPLAQSNNNRVGNINSNLGSTVFIWNKQ